MAAPTSRQSVVELKPDGQTHAGAIELLALGNWQSPQLPVNNTVQDDKQQISEAFGTHSSSQ
jgi:hypothetical protein